VWSGITNLDRDRTEVRASDKSVSGFFLKASPYIGFTECVHSAEWMTDRVRRGGVRPRDGRTDTTSGIYWGRRRSPDVTPQPSSTPQPAAPDGEASDRPDPARHDTDR
jgi:hypothetical protein